MKREWGNISQIVSAISALALCFLAIYGVFFSKTSQALVGYLQSELALRNIRIVGLEQTEKDLQRSIAESKVSLNGLSEEKADLEKQIATLRVAQETFSKQAQELSTKLAGTTFSLAREKISVSMAGVLSELDVISLKAQTDWMDKGVQAQTIRPWQSYLRTVQEKVSALPEADRVMGQAVRDKFIQQCSQFSSLVIQVPAMRVPSTEDFTPYGHDIDKHPMATRAKAISKQVRKAQDDIQACFKSLTQ